LAIHQPIISGQKEKATNISVDSLYLRRPRPEFILSEAEGLPHTFACTGVPITPAFGGMGGNAIYLKCYAYMSENRMSTAKQDVEQLLNKLPDDCSVEDIQYHLYVLDKVRRGLEDARANGTLPQDEAETRLSKWLTE
jgi:hypothetical protein